MRSGVNIGVVNENPRGNSQTNYAAHKCCSAAYLYCFELVACKRKSVCAHPLFVLIKIPTASAVKTKQNEAIKKHHS